MNEIYWITRLDGIHTVCNAFSNTEWLAVCLAEELLIKQGKDWRDYFSYKVDSSD